MTSPPRTPASAAEPAFDEMRDLIESVSGVGARHRERAGMSDLPAEPGAQRLSRTEGPKAAKPKVISRRSWSVP